MTQFLAKVGTLTGDIEELALTADSESVLRDELQDKGFHVFWVRKSFGLRALRNPFSARERITHTEFTLFNQELAALLRAGLPLLQSLDIMLERMKKPAVQSGAHGYPEQSQIGDRSLRRVPLPR